MNTTPPQVPMSNSAAPAGPVIVAIGSSAGGLEALRAFFGAARVQPSVAFVVVTHLPARHLSNLAELLARAGEWPSTEAIDGEVVRGGRVYVMPPGRLISLRMGTIAFEPEMPERQPAPKPIDFFMQSLAEEAAGRSIGIVLSGTDHDGTLGLKAIKSAGGMTLVQTPGTAEFPGMPQSAIAAGVADRVLAPDHMPAALWEWLGHFRGVEAGLLLEDDELSGDDGPDPLLDVLTVLLARTGNDFRGYRPGMLRRRLRRRMVLLGCDGLAQYLPLLEHSAEEASALSSEFLIGVTDFFRDTPAWEALAESYVPALVAGRSVDGPPVRIWTPGCSTGEESYSIAMLLQEEILARRTDVPVQVFGTDLDLDALAVARKGVYTESISATVSAQRLARFFDHRDGHFVVRKSLRDAVMFAPQNLIRDTPFSQLDVVSCRNVLMYLDTAAQERVLKLFHFALKPGGLLWLGKAESLGAQASLFEPVARDIRLFRRVGGRSHLPLEYTSRPADAVPGWHRRASTRPPPASEVLQRHLAGRPADAAVLVDRDGRALHFQGDTARFLAPHGDATLEFVRMVRSELRIAARTVLREVGEGREASRRVSVDGRQVQVQAEPVTLPDGHSMAVFVFTATPGKLETTAERIESADHWSAELEDGRRELALALEDAERSNEDLRQATEEALSLNEELQSANEELESSKEELHSLNEELATVNAQLEDKLAEVARQADDLNNLLRSTHIATLLLDHQLRIKRFTPAAAELFKLRAGDEGRSLEDFGMRVQDPAFGDAVRAVLDGQVTPPAEVLGPDGAIFLRRLYPFRAADGHVDGAVLSYVDVTSLRDAARQVGQLIAVLAGSNDAVFTYALDGTILTWNRGAERAYGYRQAEALALKVFDLVPPGSHPGTRESIERVSRLGSIGPDTVDRRASDGRSLRVSATVSALADEQGRVYALLSTERDLTDGLRAETELRFRRLVDDIPALLRVEDRHGMAEFVNRACADFTGRPREELLDRGWLRFVHPADIERYLQVHAAALARQGPSECDFRLLRHDGVYRWIRSFCVPQAGLDGQTGYVSLMLDVEDRKQAEDALLLGDRRKDEFLAMLAHELRNPLAPISNATRLLQSNQDPKQAAWAVSVIARQTGTLAKLLDGLLDVARFARGKATLDLAPVDLCVIVTRAVEVCQPLVDERGQHLAVMTPGAPLIVEGDLVRLTQVLANLVGNAAKYTNRGGHIRVELEQHDGQAVIRVADDGVGIAADMLPRVFDLFAQADRTLDRSRGGLGIGLTLVRQLVTLHRGHVEAASEGPEQGSTFTVRLPLLSQGVSPSQEAQAVAPLPLAAQARRVLIVDDNIDSAQTLAGALRVAGHDVRIAGDAVDALKMADGVAFDAFVLDIGLPGMDGYALARELRGRVQSARAMLIALTGYGQPEDVEAAHRAGFDQHMVKPADVDQLCALLDRARRSS